MSLAFSRFPFFLAPQSVPWWKEAIGRPYDVCYDSEGASGEEGFMEGHGIQTGNLKLNFQRKLIPKLGRGAGGEEKGRMPQQRKIALVAACMWNLVP